MKLYDAIIGTVEKHIAPIAAKVGNQPHVRAMRDGFYCRYAVYHRGQFHFDFCISTIC